MNLVRVVSGGQSGVDQGGWRAAKLAGVSTGGWMPSGFLTEDGPRPEFAERFGAKPLESESYPARTRHNVIDSDCTLIFMSDAHPSPGSDLTKDLCQELGKPFMVVLQDTEIEPTPEDVAAWIARHGFKILNVAGSRESDWPGIGARTEVFVSEVLRILEELA